MGGAFLLLAGTAGCQPGRIYTVKNLPADLRAAPVTDVQTLDLSRLAGPPVSNDRIESGDVIDVSIAAALTSDAVTKIPVRVGDDGMAFLPELGQVQVAGLSTVEAAQAISSACIQRGLFRQPQVTVTVQQRRLNRITVVGAVKQPGVHELPRSASYLLAALVAAGGLAEDAGSKVEIRYPAGPSALASQDFAGSSAIQLVSHQENTPGRGIAYVCLNLADAVSQGGAIQYLADGTTIMVERRRPRPLQVIGLVKKPGEYEVPVGRELRLLNAIARAEGISATLADKVYVIRSQPGTSEGAVIEVSLSRAKHDPEENLLLQPGDVVSVEHTPATAVMETIHQIPFTFGASIPLF